MDCRRFEALIEAIADGSLEPPAEAVSHLQGCSRCRAALDAATSLDRFLRTREVPAPPASFTAGVMALVKNERWRTERIVDIGFNIAVVTGALTIIAGIAGLAWSFGLLTITVDLDAVARVLSGELAGRVVSEAQTVGIAGALLITALTVWWWVESQASA